MVSSEVFTAMADIYGVMGLQESKKGVILKIGMFILIFMSKHFTDPQIPPQTLRISFSNMKVEILNVTKPLLFLGSCQPPVPALVPCTQIYTLHCSLLHLSLGNKQQVLWRQFTLLPIRLLRF